MPLPGPHAAVGAKEPLPYVPAPPGPIGWALKYFLAPGAFALAGEAGIMIHRLSPAAAMGND